MSGHLFLGGPVHGEWHDLPGSPSRCDFAVCPEEALICYTNDPPKMEEIAVTRFAYEPFLVLKRLERATVYVPAHLSKDLQWELVKALGLGRVPEG